MNRNINQRQSYQYVLYVEVLIALRRDNKHKSIALGLFFNCISNCTIIVINYINFSLKTLFFITYMATYCHNERLIVVNGIHNILSKLLHVILVAFWFNYDQKWLSKSREKCRDFPIRLYRVSH